MNSSNFPIDIFASQEKQLVSDEYVRFTEKLTQPTILFLTFLGVFTNVINIRVFLEQGVKNSNTNMGLFALAVFDFLYCFLMIPPISCQIFNYTDSVSGFLICRTHANYTVFLAMVCGYCSNWTTVYISLERTLCVVIPLKVKQFLRPKVTAIIIITIFIFFAIIQMLYTTSTRIVWKFSQKLNQTISYFVELPFAKNYITIYSTVSNTFLNSLAIFIVAINTAIMIYKLNQFKKWRNENRNTASNVGVSPDSDGNQESKSSNQNRAMSSKDAELVKSVTTVTCIFLVCLSMSHIPATAILVLPGVSLSGINSNLMYLAYSIRIGFSLVNASSNFFFYIRVSTRYKEAFNAVFRKPSQGHK